MPTQILQKYFMKWHKKEKVLQGFPEGISKETPEDISEYFKEKKWKFPDSWLKLSEIIFDVIFGAVSPGISWEYLEELLETALVGILEEFYSDKSETIFGGFPGGNPGELLKQPLALKEFLEEIYVKVLEEFQEKNLEEFLTKSLNRFLKDNHEGILK